MLCGIRAGGTAGLIDVSNADANRKISRIRVSKALPSKFHCQSAQKIFKYTPLYSDNHFV